MTATADGAEAHKSLAARFGIASGQVVQEIGYDDDVDDELRSAIAAATGAELVDEDYDDVVDVVLLWWREEDGDLVDALMDAIGILADQGVVWLLTPKPGRDGHVEASDIADAAPTAGLQATSTLSAVVDPGQVKAFPARGWRTATLTITASATGGVRVDGPVVVTVQGALPTAGVMRHGVLTLQVGPFLRTGTSRITVSYLGSTSVAPSQTTTSVVVVR